MKNKFWGKKQTKFLKWLTFWLTIDIWYSCGVIIKNNNIKHNYEYESKKRY